VPWRRSDTRANKLHSPWGRRRAARRWSISAGSEVVGALVGREGVDDAADGVPEVLDGVCGGLALQLREGVLDRIELGAVGREVEQARARILDRRTDAQALVAAEVVHDDDVAWLQLGNQHLIDIGPSSTIGAAMPMLRGAATKVVVFQWPCGMGERRRSPRSAR
jgi:hypothetical protein